MYLVFLILVGAFFWAVAAGSVLGAVAAYVCAGIVWRIHEHRRPLLFQPVQDMPLLSVLLWPLRLPTAVHGYFGRYRQPLRFGVMFINEPTRETERFASWDQALAFARKEAAESGKAVVVTDMAKFWTFRGQTSYKMYRVLPSGEIKTGKDVFN